MKSGKANKFTVDINQKSLQSVRGDLSVNLNLLDRLLYVTNQSHDLPVAFASNALYILERNGGGNREYYDNILLPILRKKSEYLHAEGVAQTVWALANAEIWDS